MTKEIIKPLKCTEEHLEYLYTLRESGVTNMFGTYGWLHSAFYHELSEQECKEILVYWMKTFKSK